MNLSSQHHTTRSALTSLTAPFLYSTLGVIGALSLSGCSSTSSTLSAPLSIPDNAIIAHRGDSYNAPEATLPAYLLACEFGADYLEVDLQRSKDGVLIAVHDNNLRNKTNIAEIYPERADSPVSSFTWAELEKLDAGSWFNNAYPERARESYRGLQLMTLDQVREVAENCSHQPGLYIETKLPELFPGIEADLRANLQQHGWLDKEMKGKVILQTFEKESLVQLQAEMPNTPKVLLLWTGDGYIDMKPTEPKQDDESWAAYYARVQVASKSAYEEWIDFAKDNGAIGVGPSGTQANFADSWSSNFSYMDLAKPWMIKMNQQKGLVTHIYTLDDAEDLIRYRDRGVTGFFTNRPNLAVEALTGRPAKDVTATLVKLGY
ncbi:glycerophosphodiester phosphodiesterase [Vibrio metschnikovii]|uniref:Glycerophosphodiester phosphodiesterase n=3 Tax=Unclassified Bacteria TaxID=49928 RepID=A0AAU6UVN6_UNCXX|nr:glycerophosphodiester phosphodiesterase [Vibrio metschnikovii]EKO3588458.1 glycerophosphodiester phosphodiesterase [Vibrio metschnikovii]EKO3641272.1 glycerophosphodiester phosphodiesterase [Vibrio metschnikovii]EKO3662698.1 glycerophosphodiester phosphodiesterase [Vibrio metschnikovii]EKO3717914.1 glycerophosphodiester phosphodiesterase [Vibrio metschnikovii]EKO3722068.1 glycerophosphodiester phosphodiesterase [Vibrio metschnikovii]